MEKIIPTRTRMETGAIEEANQEDEPDVKVILLGDSAVGKSKLVERFLDDEYQPRRVNFFLFYC